ncbi:MAG TPA: RagB/SusD family nutrient uptake outer membrane protein [Balneolales bacterium]|nr:RagB/SusD family nutrient uptake outer membrane protein [Balneolales bacterium]
MKIKVLYVTLITGILTLTISCKDYLNTHPISSSGPETVFSTVDNARKAVFGAYQDLAGDQGYGIRVSMYFPYDSDIYMGATGDGDGDRRDISRYNLTPSNKQLFKPFNQLYQGIERANQCIKYIPQMDLYKNGSSQQTGELHRLYGEALTLRAQYYFELVRDWGDVPAQWVPSADNPDLFLHKTNRDSIYDHIINDLHIAEAIVPWTSEVGSLGDPNDERITKGAVKGLRARIALYRGGYSLRKDGKMERSSDYLKYYQIADSECASIIQRPDEHSLDPSFQDLWKNDEDAHRIDPYGEIMFQVAMSGGTGSTDSKLGYYNGPRVNGKGNSSVYPLPSYFYSFDSLDSRRDVTITPYWVNADGTIVAQAVTSLADGKFRRNWITNPSFDPTNNAQNLGLNWPILRFSDVLLMYAEAENEIHNGPTQAAIDAYLQVRERAFAGHPGDVGTPPANKAGFFNAIVNERAWEFGGEGIRKFDLVRWNLLGQKLNETKTILADMANHVAPYDQLPTTMYYKVGSTTLEWANSLYKPAPASAPSGYTGVSWVTTTMTTSNNFDKYAEGFKPNHSELFPLPQSVIETNPNLTQDYGY